MSDTASVPPRSTCGDAVATPSPLARFSTLTRRSKVLFCLFGALLGALIAHQGWVQHQAATLTVQSRQALSSIALLRLQLSDLQSSMIVFEHAQNPDLLAPRIACGAVCEHLPQIARHVADTAEMQETLQRARVWDARLAASLQNALLAAQRGEPGAKVEELLAQAREVELPQLQRKIDEIAYAEVQRLGARQALAAAATQRLLLALGLMTLCALAAVRWLHREARQSMEAGLRLEQQAQQLALEDRPTGLPNLRLLAEIAPLLLNRARRHQQAVALMRVGLNGYEEVKDLHGATEGERLLRATADRMRSTLRDGDLLARLEDNEFVVLLDGSSSANEVLRVGQRLVEAAGEPVTLANGAAAEVSLSIGLACFPSDGQQLESLLIAADGALHAARRAGENRLCRAGREPVTHVLTPAAPRQALMTGTLPPQPA